MFWKILILLVIIVAIILVIGPCVYYNFLEKNIKTTDMPDEKKATHSFYIENSGGLILASDFEQHGQSPGSRIFILHGFWEMRGNKFKFVDGDINLDENIFGTITVEKRGK